MWIATTTGFLNIVRKDCGPDELMVRARRKADIRQLFPDVTVVEGGGTDYAYRAVIPAADVAAKVAGQVATIDYDDFKTAVRDRPLYDAYMAVWRALSQLR